MNAGRAPESIQNRWKRSLIIACLGLRALTAAGCGSAPPTMPSPPDLSGAWIGEQTLASFSGGECLAPVFEDLLGFPSQFRANLTQSGTRVTATLDIDHTGSVCTYAGTIQGNTLDLTTTSCTGTRVVAVTCPNGAVRGLVPVSESIHATIDGGNLAGNATENDAVVESITLNNVGTLVGNSTFTLIRQ